MTRSAEAATARRRSCGSADEVERFSTDAPWMPRLVLMAKNSYVWLEQLSRKYGRWIQTLNQIPDEELDRLQRAGFTGLWLIGLWERSRASQRIKQRMGQEDAVASAYSLYSYDIAEDLGGGSGAPGPRARAAAAVSASPPDGPHPHGHRLRRIMEHPDWFLSLDAPPYPSYTFTPPTSRTTCASVSFSRITTTIIRMLRWSSSARAQSGDSRFIYHGNDGTSFPERHGAVGLPRGPRARGGHPDHPARGAQLPDHPLRCGHDAGVEAHPAARAPRRARGSHPLARRARQLTRARLAAGSPAEFWREAVDRVAAEVPDTLLLAEAFWLMEGYFVRTLGMHRVFYNSAFMHMLRDEDNAKYRALLREHASPSTRASWSAT